jgi:hypothetical protein
VVKNKGQVKKGFQKGDCNQQCQMFHKSQVKLNSHKTEFMESSSGSILVMRI